jgi:AraC-like DNA-binding protein
LIGVLGYFYFLALTNAQFKFEARHWGHWVLPILYSLLIISKLAIDFGFFYPFPKTDELQGGARGYWAELDKSDWLEAITYFSFFFYAWLIFKNFRNYQNYIRQNLSFGEEVKFNWLQNVLIVATLGVLIFFGLSILELLGFDFSYQQAWYAYLLLGVGIYYISLNAYFANPKQLALLQFSNQLESSQWIDNELVKAEFKTQIAQLEQLIQSEKLYLNSELTLPELAKKLQINVNQLSKIINEGIGQNFNDYINQYRVEAVINQFQSGEHLKHTLLGIALDCGFNSKATFNRAFKKVKGTTPSDFIKLLIIKQL